MKLGNCLIDLEERLEVRIRSLERKAAELEEELSTEELVKKIEPHLARRIAQVKSGADHPKS